MLRFSIKKVIGAAMLCNMAKELWSHIARDHTRKELWGTCQKYEAIE